MPILSSIVMGAKTNEQLHCHSKLPFSASIYFKVNLTNTELCQYFTFYFFLKTKVTCQLLTETVILNILPIKLLKHLKPGFNLNC